MSKTMPMFLAAVDLIGEGKYSEAESVLNEAIKEEPENTDLYEALARLYDKTDQNDKGLEVCNLWAQRDPKSNMALTNLSVFLQKLNRIPEAEEAKARATTLFMKKSMEDARAKQAKG